MTRTHPLIADRKIFVSAGVWDVLSAKLAERAGFSTVVLSGYAVSASHLGEPDFGLLTQSEMLDVARRVGRAVGTLQPGPSSRPTHICSSTAARRGSKIE
jgi:2-methylisocitrate lyase-like PEP mutase family enzyme